ncbi:4-coumarate-CoA ligase [Mucor ambiguus]|uniref:4-coumarate-CoA ligase n=1 Tax=Mucor ambiguus TaxID=91626 RepID=A0A0C9MF91_9FUNG|nr:4-coumarate-CoA ligase [Mucor ambiguus]
MVYVSKYPTKHIPKATSIFNVLFHNNNQVPKDKLIYVDIEDASKSLTFAQVETQILKATAGLIREFDLKKGDVVAICSPNQVDYPVVLHGAVCAGGIAAAIDQMSSVDLIAADLDTVQAKVLIVHKDTLENSLAAAKLVGLPESNILVFGDVAVGSIRTVNETILQGDELATPLEFTEEEMVNNPAYLYFTSGTTGRKKAVMMTQNNILNSIFLKDDWNFNGMDILAYTEYHHASSLLAAMHLSIYLGLTTYVMAHYTLHNLCAAIEKFKIQMTTTQPFIIAALAKDNIANGYDLSSLKCVICCGAALDNSVTLTVKERLGLLTMNVYGMTEVLGVFDTDPEITEANGIGYLAAGFSARLVDDDGNDVPAGEMGELWVKGPTVARGYYRNPEATASTFDADGYLHTGDLIKCDENGMFYYVDRAKDLIKYHLHHIYPSDIENVLMTHPKVADCAAIGVYYPELTTELPRAYVHLVDGEKYTEEVEKELQEYADSRLSDEKRLRGGIVIVDSFPRTASGKIQRRVLRQNAKRHAIV